MGRQEVAVVMARIHACTALLRAHTQTHMNIDFGVYNCWHNNESCSGIFSVLCDLCVSITARKNVGRKKLFCRWELDPLLS